MKTYIIFDTNILFTRDYKDFSIFEFNSVYDEVQGKIERNDVIDRFELRVPEITVKELFKQQLQSYNSNIETIKNSYSKFDKIYEVGLQIDEKFDYENFLALYQNMFLTKSHTESILHCTPIKYVAYSTPGCA